MHAHGSFEDPSATQPSAPLYVVYGATQYTLDMSASVRRSVEQFEPPAGHDWGVGEPTRAVTESNIDLEGNQKATTCEVSLFPPAVGCCRLKRR